MVYDIFEKMSVLLADTFVEISAPKWAVSKRIAHTNYIHHLKTKFEVLTFQICN